MDNEDLEKTKSLSDLSDLIAKETEDVLPKNSDTLEDDILKNLEIEYDPFLETKYDIKNVPIAAITYVSIFICAPKS